MAELRINPFTKQEVLIFPESSKKPYFFEEDGLLNAADSLDRCPFEIEREEMQAKSLLHVPEQKPFTEGVHWVVPNKFPLFSDEYAPGESAGDVTIVPAHGAGYLFISRDHHIPYGKLPEKDIQAMVALQVTFGLRARILHPAVRTWQYFRNIGKRAGASVVHPHSQLVGLPVVPSLLRQYMEGFQEHKKCLLCEIMKQEQTYKKRIVWENEHMLCFAPAWSTARAQLWLVPKEHQLYFTEMSMEQSDSFGKALSDLTKAYYRVFGDLDYNEYLIQAPEQYNGIFHWFFVLHPRTHAGAGFELGTGIQGTDLLPEQIGEFLGLSL